MFCSIASRLAAGHYRIAILGVVLATAVRLPFEDWLGSRAPYALFYLPIIFVAWRGHMGATLLATVLSLAAAAFFVIPPRFSFYMTADHGPSLVLFALSAALLIMMARQGSKLRAVAVGSENACRRAERGAHAALWDYHTASDTFEGPAVAALFGVETVDGRAPNRVSGRAIESVVHPDDRAAFRAMLANARDGGESANAQFRVRHAEHGVRWFSATGERGLRGGSGEWISGLTIDVTDRRRAELEAKEQREWLEVTLRSIGDAVIASDVNGRVSFLNRVAEELTGWSLADAEGRYLTEVFRLVDERTRQPVESPADKVLRTRQPRGLGSNTALVARDGRVVPIADCAAPILDAEGETLGVVLVFRDVSAQRHVEDEKQTAAAERERLLDSERAARAEAERANRLKDEFVAMLSHELRTPLNAILGWVRVLQIGQRDEQALQQGLEVIERNTRVQAQLISDLLDMSRILAGKMRLDVQRIELQAVVDAALDTVRPAAEARRIAIERVGEDPLHVAADPARLQQVFWNLLSNAVKFTPEGGSVQVAVRGSDGHAEVVVQDTGRGIPREFLPMVFDRFRQVDGSPRREVGGLGLGLAIVKQLVELHGGTVQASSEGEGRGATFVVRIPVGAGADAAAPVHGTDPCPPAADTSSVRLGGLQVLVVDDDRDTREFVLRILRECGAVVAVAGSGGEALDLLASRSFDMMVCDIGMPRMDGYTLIQRVRRRDGRAARMPAIALTAYARPEDRTQALRAGFQAHLVKPMDPVELLATISSLAGLFGDGGGEVRSTGAEAAPGT